jgi:nucleoside-diphosphate-sugar epimerase
MKVLVTGATGFVGCHAVVPRDAPIGGNQATPYVASKVAAERIARNAQERGLPVTTTYPGAVYGPFDPGPGEMVHTLGNLLRNQLCFRLLGRAGLSVCDVSWLGRAHAALFAPGQGARRINMGGHFPSWNELVGTVRELTGRRLPLILPATRLMALATGRLADLLQRFLRARLPLSYESAWTVFHGAPTDDSLAIELVGPPPSISETLATAIRWMVDQGHLWAGLAGRLEVRSTAPGADRRSGAGSRRG